MHRIDMDSSKKSLEETLPEVAFIRIRQKGETKPPKRGNPRRNLKITDWDAERANANGIEPVPIQSHANLTEIWRYKSFKQLFRHRYLPIKWGEVSTGWLCKALQRLNRLKIRFSFVRLKPFSHQKSTYLN